MGLAKTMSIGKLLVKTGAETYMLFDEAAQTNAKVDQMMRLYKESEYSTALCFGAAISVTPNDGKFVVHAGGFDTNRLNTALRACALDGGTDYSVQDIQYAYQNGTLGDLKLDPYVNWYHDEGGKGKATMYRDKMVIAHNNNKHLVGYKELEQLTIEDMKLLEEYFQ